MGFGIWGLDVIRLEDASGKEVIYRRSMAISNAGQPLQGTTRKLLDITA